MIDCLANTGPRDLAPLMILAIGLLILGGAALLYPLMRKKRPFVAGALLIGAIAVVGMSSLSPSSASAATVETEQCDEGTAEQPIAPVTSSPMATPTPTVTPEPVGFVDARVAVTPSNFVNGNAGSMVLAIDNGPSATSAVPAGSTVQITTSFVGGDLVISSIDANLSCPTVSAGQVVPAVALNPSPYYSTDFSFTCTVIAPLTIGASNAIVLDAVAAPVPDAVNPLPYVSTTTISVSVPAPAVDVDSANDLATYIGSQV
ncbi:hypothetical protein ASD13_05220 [Microbacterium sp. Root1433D1]|uniref:hypothetical protein n=1 Tax=Microbacterium TaxID=33882 RepID=UPI0006FC4E8E|nr:hypothetical protein [Microbacterium sp. Root1433D1]KQY78057.1 hypothetical protein ASD13_05220 [Microbacterium sp. Root1433D1]